MSRPRLAGLTAIGLACALAVPALADPKGPEALFGDPGRGGPRDLELVPDQVPHPYGDFGSDTEFPNGFGLPTWQRMADDMEPGFRLMAIPEPASLVLLAWASALTL